MGSNPTPAARFRRYPGAPMGLWLSFVRGNHHFLLPIWLLTVGNGLAALAFHHYAPQNWLHWAHVVFYATTPLALAIAWLGDRTKRLLV